MTPIAPLIASFLREHMPIEQGCSPHTCETYAHAFRLLFVFASKRLGIKPSQICLEQIDAALILNFLADIEEHRGNCPATRNGRLAAVKAVGVVIFAEGLGGGERRSRRQPCHGGVVRINVRSPASAEGGSSR